MAELVVYPPQVGLGETVVIKSEKLIKDVMKSVRSPPPCICDRQ